MEKSQNQKNICSEEPIRWNDFGCVAVVTEYVGILAWWSWNFQLMCELCGRWYILESRSLWQLHCVRHSLFVCCGRCVVTSVGVCSADGTFWRPAVSAADRLFIFNSDLCRSVYITADATAAMSIVAGVSTLHFTPPASVFASPAQNPDNAGFCTPKGNCMLAGVLNVTRCRGTVYLLSLSSSIVWGHRAACQCTKLQGFIYAAPSVWNKLPLEIHSS